MRQQEELHKDPTYGVASLSFAPLVAEVIKQSNAKSVSDYGAGKRNLRKGLYEAGILNIDYYAYDPVFPEYGPPQAADLVCCIDVLEHIEVEFLDNILADLKKIVINKGFFSIHLGPAGKSLPDGRNAHLIQQPVSWWLPKICDYFEVLQLAKHQMMGHGVWIIVAPRLPHNLI